jgi:SAM-dependent methyltransferase
MEAVYEPFLKLLPEGAHVLDAGCGSGRDSRSFLEKGYEVTAFDASEALVALASEHAGIPVLRMRFDELHFEESFDGVWACASLLHVPQREMDGAISNLSRSLKPGGVFYASFRYGDGESVVEDGRLFNNYTEHTFRVLLGGHPEIEIVNLWRGEGIQRPDVFWLNVLLRKKQTW